MAPKKKSARPKKAIPEVTTVESGVLVPEPNVKKLELPLNVEQLNRLNGVPLPPPVIRPGEKGFGLGTELTRPLHGSALLEELSRMRQERFLTDMELACKTKAFDVHKLVISSVSQYLREVLAKDPGLKRLELPTLSPLGKTFEQITAFLQDDNLILPSEVSTFQVLWRDPREGTATWRHLTQLPAKSFNQCVAVMDGFLYVAGGEDQNDARNQAKHAVGTLSRYDPRFNTWLHLTSMRQRRTHFSLVATNGRLYAIGGRNTDGLLATIESYQPSTNTWQLRTPMDMPRCCHSSAVLPSGDILVTGGYVNCAYSRSVIQYSIDRDAWSEKGELETPRGWHCSALLAGKVYVVGGSQLGAGGVRIDVMTMEVFSPESQEWSRAANLPIGVSTAGMSPIGCHLYILGGWNEAEKRYKSAVQRYDPGTDSWAAVEDLPEPIVGVSCCALGLPPRHTSRRHRNTPSHEDHSSLTQQNNTA